MKKVTLAGWTVENCFRFNAFAIPGWFLTGSVLKRSKPGRDLTRVYDFLIPALALVVRNIIGGASGARSLPRPDARGGAGGA